MQVLEEIRREEKNKNFQQHHGQPSLILQQKGACNIIYSGTTKKKSIVTVIEIKL
jgi:hypothetical protein